MGGRTLIIYSGHEINENFLFFCRNGYIDNAKYDFVFIFNNPSLKLEFSIEKPNVKIMTRENIGLDFGGWTDVLLSKDPDNEGRYLYEKYDYFILLNSTVRGPFLPIWYDQLQYGYWPELFTSKLNDDVKLVGAAVAFYMMKPFISSAFLVMDQLGLKVARDSRIIDPQTIDIKKCEVVMRKEIGLSDAIIQAGYNIYSMLQCYRSSSLKDYLLPQTSLCHLNPNAYYGIDVNPYEVIFIKQNRKIEPLVMDRYTDWSTRKGDPISRITYGISESESIDVTQRVMEHIVKRKYILKMGTDMRTLIGRDPYPKKLKKLFIYMHDSSELPKIVEEEKMLLQSNIVFI
jgi:hypothetical protein